LNYVATTEAAVSLRQLTFEHTSLERYGFSQLDPQTAALNVDRLTVVKKKISMDNSLGIKKVDQCTKNSSSLIFTIVLLSWASPMETPVTGTLESRHIMKVLPLLLISKILQKGLWKFLSSYFFHKESKQNTFCSHKMKPNPNTCLAQNCCVT
jgi:hypothetical protein